MGSQKFVKITNPESVAFNLKTLKNLVFEVTDACNLQCKYCGYSEFYEGYDNREDSYLPFSKAKMLIDHLADIWRENRPEGVQNHLNIGFYGGEPLLNMAFIEEVTSYVESLQDIGKAITYNMTSNAMLLDRYMDFLVEKNISLLISLDGDEYGQSYRIDKAGNNSFSRVIKNVKLLQEKYPKYFEDRVNFNTVLHNRNEVEEVFRFIQQTFGKIPRIAPLNNAGIREDKREEFYRTYKNPTQSFEGASDCAKLTEEMFVGAPPVDALARHLYHYSGNIFDDYRGLKIDPASIGIAQSGTCIPFMVKLFVTVNGKILQCEKINHEFAVGQIHDDRVELDLQTVVDKQNGYLQKLEEQCAVCAHIRRCNMCVYQIDHLGETDVRCHNFSTSDTDFLRKRVMDFLGEYPHMYRRIIDEVVMS